MKATLDFAAKTIELEGSPTLAEIRNLQESLVGWKEWKIVPREVGLRITNPMWQGDLGYHPPGTVISSSGSSEHLAGFPVVASQHIPKDSLFFWSGHTGPRKISNPDAFPKPTGAKTL